MKNQKTKSEKIEIFSEVKHLKIGKLQSEA